MHHDEKSMRRNSCLRFGALTIIVYAPWGTEPHYVALTLSFELIKSIDTVWLRLGVVQTSRTSKFDHVVRATTGFAGYIWQLPNHMHVVFSCTLEADSEVMDFLHLPSPHLILAHGSASKVQI